VVRIMASSANKATGTIEELAIQRTAAHADDRTLGGGGVLAVEELFDADQVDAACADLADGEGFDRVDKM
jgi:hypothetical protein